MLYEIDAIQLVEPALDWFWEHRRELPWRENVTPYRVWVSEIMLQQTRVEAVKPYFHRFMEELPTIEALAECPEDRLLKLWEGLGYYSRARNLKKAAQVMVREFGGEMPGDHDRILALPGIGPYTAGAISSIAFGLPYPAVDGNVLRIMARVSDDDRDILLDSVKKDVTHVLTEVMRSLSPAEERGFGDRAASALRGRDNITGTFNQALMEIGALVCAPNGMPRCEDCPWKELCLSRKRGTSEVLPVRIKKTKRRVEKRTVLLVRDGERVWIRKRPDKGLLAGMYEFPNPEGHLSETEVLDYVRALGLDPLRVEKLVNAKHLFSHIEWQMQGYMIRVAALPERVETPSAGDLFVELEQIEKSFAIPSAFEKYSSYLWDIAAKKG